MQCTRNLLFYVHVFALVFTSSYVSANIEKYLKTCDRNSEKINECLAGAIQEGLTTMAEGIPEMDVPPVDPYHQKELKMEYKRNQIIAKMTMKNIKVYGLKTSKVKNVRFRPDDDRFYIEVDMTTPRVYVEGNYIGAGNYNALQVNTTGHFNTTMTDLVYTWKITGVPEKKGDETYIKIDSFYMRPDVGNLKAYITNDNPSTRQITDLGNQFANNNWKVLYREFLPFAQSNWNKIGTRVGNKLFLKVPYDQLFPAKS